MLYENQQIGNFNYLLGYYLGRNNYQKPFSINTYQQTYGHDATVGDMFGNLGGKYFIIEFKRSKKEYNDELKKNNRIKLLKKLTTSNSMKLLSEKGHFLCHNVEFQSSNLITKRIEHVFIDYSFSTYSKLIDCKFQDFESAVIGIQEFTMNLVFNKIPSGQKSIGLNYDELKTYLKMMKDCADYSDYETTGAVSCFDSDTGSMTSLKFESLRELDKQLNVSIENSLEIGKFSSLGRIEPLLPPSNKKSRGM